MLGKLPSERDSIVVAKLDVNERDVRLKRSDSVERLAGCGGLADNLDPLRPEQPGGRGEELRAVVDQQPARIHEHQGSRFDHRSAMQLALLPNWPASGIEVR